MAATAAIPRIEEKERFISRPTESGSEISRKIRSQGSVCLRVLGGSMTPWIRSGDLVFIKRFDFERVSTGDVILFERDDRFFVHRIIGRVHNRKRPERLISVSYKRRCAGWSRCPCFSGGISRPGNPHSSWTPSHRSGIFYPCSSWARPGALLADEPAAISPDSVRQATFSRAKDKFPANPLPSAAGNSSGRANIV